MYSRFEFHCKPLPTVLLNPLFMTRWLSQFSLDNQSLSGSVLSTGRPENCIDYRSGTHQHAKTRYRIREALQGPDLFACRLLLNCLW